MKNEDILKRVKLLMEYNPSKNTVVVEGKYVAYCSSCNHKHQRFRKPKYDVSCGNCSGGSYNKNFKLDFVQNKEASGNLSGLTV